MIRSALILGIAAFVGDMRGPDAPYSDCCSYVNDLDNDGDVDLMDFKHLQNGWGCDDLGNCGHVTWRTLK